MLVDAVRQLLEGRGDALIADAVLAEIRKRTREMIAEALEP